MTQLAAVTLRLARASLGEREDLGPNRGLRIRLYQRWARLAEGSPWCVAFALYMVHDAARALHARSELPRTGSSGTLYRWYRGEGLILQRPVAGCIGMVRGGPTGHRHTFLVESVAGGVVCGIDGNWRDAVARTTRPATDCDFGPIL